jgi:hypothetical protein
MVVGSILVADKLRAKRKGRRRKVSAAYALEALHGAVVKLILTSVFALLVSLAVWNHLEGRP